MKINKTNRVSCPLSEQNLFHFYFSHFRGDVRKVEEFAMKIDFHLISSIERDYENTASKLKTKMFAQAFFP